MHNGQEDSPHNVTRAYSRVTAVKAVGRFSEMIAACFQTIYIPAGVDCYSIRQRESMSHPIVVSLPAVCSHSLLVGR